MQAKSKACNTVLLDAPYFERAIRKSRHRFSLPVLLLRMAGDDPGLRMKLLEFVDVLPALYSPREICGHFTELVASGEGTVPTLLRLVSRLFALPGMEYGAARALVWLIYEKLAPHFMVGDETTLASLKKGYKKEGARISVDFLGESVTSEREARHFLELYRSAIQNGGGSPKEPFHVSVKLSSLYPFFSPENYAESKRRVSLSLSELLCLAEKYHAFVTVDAEQYAFRHLVEDIFCEVVSQECFKRTELVGIALQAYRRDAFASAIRLVETARTRGAPFLIRLVKGAYWDTEVALAAQNNWPVPLFTKKEETDRNFERVFTFLACHWKTLYVSPATHNPESIAYVRGIMDGLGLLSDANLMFQVLYGLGAPVRKALCKEGLPVLVYVPVWAMAEGMAYCARRILENTSNDGFLRRLLG